MLQSIKDELYGTVKLVFQPSEEEALFPGAQGIVDSGILDDVDEIFWTSCMASIAGRHGRP